MAAGVLKLQGCVQLQKCPTSDLSPCPLDKAWEQTGDAWTRYPVQWPHILEGMELDHPDYLADIMVNTTANATELHI